MSSRFLRALAVTSCALAFTPAAALADEPAPWPQWRGPDRNGQIGGPAWPAALDAASLERMWRIPDLGPSYAGPIVGPERVYTVETLEKREEIARAYDRRTGELVWTARWEGAMSVPFFAAKNGSWVRSTPAFDGERLYVGGMRDLLVCLDAATGEVVWRCDFMERLGTELPTFGLVCSPLIDGDHIYLQAAASLAKLDKMTGEILWRSLVDRGGMNDSAFSSPILSDLAGRRQLVMQTRTHLAGVDPEGGDVLWEHPVKAFRGMNILTPLVTGDAIFTAPYGGKAQKVAIRAEGDGFAADRAWSHRTQGYMTSPVEVDGHAYFFSRANRFICMNLETGEPAWVSPSIGDNYWSLVAQGDRILALSDTGRLRLIAADPGAYRVLGEVEVAEAQTWAHLAVADDTILIREQNALTSFRWRGGEAPTEK